MPPHLEIIAGGKLTTSERSSTPANHVMAEVELAIAQYVESMLIQLEAVSRLVQIEDLAHSLGMVRHEAGELVRRLNQLA